MAATGSLTEATQEVVFVVDADRRVRSVSPSIEDELGLQATAVEGCAIVELVDPNDRGRLLSALAKVGHDRHTAQRLALRLLNGTGWPVWVDAHVQGLGLDDVVVAARPYVASDSAAITLPSVDPASSRFHALVQNSADIIMVLDPDGIVRFANPSMLQTLGLEPADLHGTQVLDIFHPDDHDPVTAALVEVLEDPAQRPRVEMRTRHADGSYRWIEGTLQNLIEHPEVGGILGNGRDITDRRLAEVALRASEERFRSLAASSPSAIFELDREGRLTYANERWFDITGRAADPADVWSIIHPDDVPAVLGQWADDREVGAVDARVRVLRPDGTERWVDARTRPVLSDSGAVDGHVGTLHDVTDVQHYQDELARQALHDPLTGLPNRLQLLERLGPALLRARESGSPLALLFIDLDRFKVVNDSLGHQAGDELLVALSRRLTQTVRPGDLVTRFGGDEFVVLCERIETPDAVVALAERMLKQVAGPVTAGDSTVHVSVSIGVVVGSGDEEPGDLLRDADAAMYHAKGRGRDRVEVFDEGMREQAVRRLRTEQALRLGLERGELVLHFQPIADLYSGAMLGAEALLRWQHPDEGLLAPRDFLAIAEESALIVPMGNWVIAEACRQAVKWPVPDGGDPLKVFVNLSGSQLGAPGLVDRVAKSLSDSGLEPDRLHLEITEGMLMDGDTQVGPTLHELRRLGVRVAVDDFGTGYSSLSYLTRLPVDLLKIDRSFVMGIGRRAGDQEVAGAIVGLAHALGLHAVAEGVETPEQAAVLRALGCDAAQGFLLSPPLDPEALVTFVRDGTTLLH